MTTVDEIRQQFVDGINEVYSTMFTDGVNNGVYFYPLHEPAKKSVYKEVKYKQYLSPVLLVAKVQISPEVEEEDVKAQKGRAVISVTVKSLQDNGIDVSYNNLLNIKKGVMKYKDTFYDIDTIEPKVFVRDSFMVYEFKCTEDLSTKEVEIYEPPVEEGEEDVETANDR